MEEVLFIPTGSPPHKEGNEVSNPKFRYEMASLAIQDNKYFSISRIEIDRTGKSYTVDTLRELQRIYPDYELNIITS